eukprot:g2258.t1
MFARIPEFFDGSLCFWSWNLKDARNSWNSAGNLLRSLELRPESWAVQQDGSLPTGIPLAVKIVRVEDKTKRDQLINEIHTLFRISKSHFLIELYDAYVHKESGCVHVALEYMD